MKNLFKILAASLVMISFTSAQAEMKYGISASLTQISASGNETENGEKHSAKERNNVVIPSVFVEYAFSNGIAVGLDYIPMSADVSSEVRTRTDTETSVSGTAAQTDLSRKQTAQASLSDHFTLYSNFSLSDNWFIKGGLSHVSLNTDESLPTGAKYGNVDIMGYVMGLGFETGPVRMELAYTDYEDISIKSSTTRTDVTDFNQIDADLDTLGLKLSYVF
jgi:long-subunit fatty acid transport protein